MTLYDTENKILEIFSRIFARPIEEINFDDNFFLMGGDSMIANQLINQVNDCFNINVDVSGLFEATNIREYTQGIYSLSGRNQIKKMQEKIQRVERNEDLVSSNMQRQIWFRNQYFKDESIAYRSVVTYRMNGLLNIRALNQAFNTIIHRHEVLRTKFQPNDDTSSLNQIIEEKAELNILPKRIKQEELDTYLFNLSNYSFDLSIDTPMRVDLLQTAAEEYVLIICTHDIAFDLWSINLLRRELSITYQAFSEGKEPLLQELNSQYVDYVYWHMDKVQAGLPSQVEFWRKKLHDAPPFLTLPTDFSRDDTRNSNQQGSTVRRVIPKNTQDAFTSLAHGKGVTLFTALLAVYHLALWRFSHQRDLIIAMVTSTRDLPELESLIGPFVNTLPIRITASETLTFTEFLQLIKASVLEVLDNKDVDLSDIVRLLGPNLNVSNATPFIQAMFSMQNTIKEALKLEGMKIQKIERINRGARVELLLRAFDDENGLLIWAEYSENLFLQETIAKFLEQFEIIMARAIENPESKLSELIQ